MKRSDRLLAILLHLRAGHDGALTAAELAERLEVSIRTIYRDIDALSGLGVPIYAEKGPHGGFRLLEGYFLPAIAFTRDEAVALVVAQTMMRSLRARPLGPALETAEAKLLAAMPSHLSTLLANAATLIGFEGVAPDAFHRDPPALDPLDDWSAREGTALDTFLRAVLDGTGVRLTYRSPYRGRTTTATCTPLGLFCDRDLWYLVGARLDEPDSPRLWRADRVLEIASAPAARREPEPFDVRELLGRRWLGSAMTSWAVESPVRLQITRRQAAWLQADWYYRHALYEPDGESVMMIFGERNQSVVFELVRWLGPGAELLEPHTWRAALSAELAAMQATYQE
jgi:predicted DNA-binding transcriptional regulator YafY